VSSQSPDPTPAEIEAACAEIQAGWTDLMREARHTHYETTHVTKRKTVVEYRVPQIDSRSIRRDPMGENEFNY